jgi:hypothetical protein
LDSSDVTALTGKCRQVFVAVLQQAQEPPLCSGRKQNIVDEFFLMDQDIKDWKFYCHEGKLRQGFDLKRKPQRHKAIAAFLAEVRSRGLFAPALNKCFLNQHI